MGILALALTFGGLVACGGGGGGAAMGPPSACTTVAAAPASLVATSITAGTAILSWASSPPSGCTLSFRLYQDGVQLGAATGSSQIKVSGLASSTSYQFTVDATDAAGTSPKSAQLAVTTSGGGTIFNGITLTGKLIWHSYASYGFSGVKSWMANFDTGDVYDITPSRLLGGMNYHFSPDGASVVVMGDDNNVTSATGATGWDVWVASVTATGLANLTKITNSAVDGSRNEDPKFSSDGTRIIFKRNLTNIVSIDVAGISLNGSDQAPAQTLLLASPTEVSMPYYLAGTATSFLYTDEATKSIRLDAAGTVSSLYTVGSHAYYPIAIDPTHFYFAAGQANDWIYRGDTGGLGPTSAAFITSATNTAEFADPYPISGDWLAFTSTVAGGSGGYDIWIGNFVGGQSFDLDNWIRGANHANNDLGPTFHGTLSP